MRFASVPALIIFAGSIGLVSYAIGGPAPVSPSDTGTEAAPTNTSLGSTSTSQSNSGASGSQDDQSSVAGTDADGLPVLKRKPGKHREKVIELKNGEKLPTSGVDPKFKGSLLNTGIDAIAIKSPGTAKETVVINDDSRFKTRQLSLKKDQDGPHKKNEGAVPASSASPSPSASPTATPAANR